MKKHSFAKGDRLLKPAEFARVKKLGKKRFTENFTAYLLSTQNERTRIGISASARVTNAVKRNRIKRLIREFFRLNKGALPPSMDMLIAVRKDSSGNTYSQTEAEMKRLFIEKEGKP